MAIRVVRLGSPRERGEALRLGTVRRPPRGVPKGEIASRDFYDVWLPDVAPSEPLLKLGKEIGEPAARPPRGPLACDDFSIGCYCADESRCHRSILRELLAGRGAAIAPGSG